MITYNDEEQLAKVQKEIDDGLIWGNKQLQAKVLAWRQKLKLDINLFDECPYRYAKEYLEEFDKHFNITIDEN